MADPSSLVYRGQQSWKQTLHDLHLSNVPASADTFASLLKSCGNAKTLSHGKFVHHCILKSRLGRKGVLGSLLLQMYEKCGALEDAMALFSSMQQRDVFSTNVIIKAHARRERGQEALQFFSYMLQEALMPNRVTFICMLSAYETLAEGKQMHARIADSQLESDVVVGTALVNMYGRCGSLDDAKKVFDKMPDRNVVSWTTMIALYARHCEAHVVLQYFCIMQQEGIPANSVTFVFLLAACAYQAALADGKLVHALLLDSGLESDVFVETALVNMYGKCGSLKDAQRIFVNMPVRNVVSWTAMISVYAQQGEPKEALEVLDQMLLGGVAPNNVTYVSILAACASDAVLDEGKHVHACILNNGSESDRFVGTALFNMYGKCGSMEDAQIMFDRVSGRNVVSWNAMIVLYTEHGQGKEALNLFGKMQQGEIIPDNVTFLNLLSACTSLASVSEGKRIHSSILDHGLEKDVLIRTALINMYGKCGNLEDAHRIFDKMPDRDVALWNAMIEVYAEHAQGKKALQLCEQMQREGFVPDNVTFVSILTACLSQTALADCKWMHTHILDSGFDSDLVVGSALVNMYGKCGSLEDAQMVFNKLSELNTVSWTAMIAAYTHHGHSEAALHTFHQMQQVGVVPDRVTFVIVLAACSSKAGLVNGERIHALILDSKLELDFVVSNALVNMYGKCGNVEKARRMFDKMLKRDLVSWNAIIAVYAQHGEGKQALLLFDQMQLQGVLPDKITYVSILGACSRAGLFDDGCRFFASMMQDRYISPVVTHYICMIDLLGRAGRLDEAEKLMNGMPFQPTIASYMSLLGACRYQWDVERGERTANYVFELDPENGSPYVMLSNIYAAAGRSDDAAQLMNIMRVTGLQQMESAARDLTDIFPEADLLHLQMEGSYKEVYNVMTGT